VESTRESTRYCGQLLAYVPDPGDCGEVDGMKCDSQGKPKYSEKNLPQRHFVHHKSNLPDPGANAGCRGGKAATNRFSYGAANSELYF
jgi:hypothetical protein